MYSVPRRRRELTNIATAAITSTKRIAAFLLKDGALALADEGGRLILCRAALQDTDSRGFYAIDFLAPLGELMERDGALFLERE